MFNIGQKKRSVIGLRFNRKVSKTSYPILVQVKLLAAASQLLSTFETGDTCEFITLEPHPLSIVSKLESISGLIIASNKSYLLSTFELTLSINHNSKEISYS